MNPPPEKTDPQRRRGFFTRKRLLLLLVLGLATGFVLLIANQEQDGQQSSSTSILETLRNPREWAKQLYESYQRKRDLAAQRKLIQQKISKLGAEHPEVLEVRENYAKKLFLYDQLAEAEPEFESILQIRERVFGPDDRSIKRSRILLAQAIIREGMNDQAEVQYRTLLKTQERAGGKEADETHSILYSLADCLMQQGKRVEAIPYAQRAVDGYRQVIGSNDLERAYIERHIKYAETLLEDLQRKK